MNCRACRQRIVGLYAVVFDVEPLAFCSRLCVKAYFAAHPMDEGEGPE